MPDKSAFSSQLNAFYALPQGNYHTPHTPKIDPEQAALVTQEHTATTNAASTKPIIGTVSVSTCLGLIFYNRKTKTAFIGHTAIFRRDEYAQWLRQIRQNDTDKIDVHIIGVACSKSDNEENSDSINLLNEVAGLVAQTPNATVKTCDVFDKPKPLGFAIDARNGRLIRGSDFARSHEAAEALSEELFQQPQWTVVDGNFDGTQAEYQKSRRRG